MKVEGHAVYPMFSAQEVAGYARIKGVSEIDALAELLRIRAVSIAEERRDPFRAGWEPPIWQVCRALLDRPCPNQEFVRHVRDRFGYSWEEWSEAMRVKLGFEQPVRMLLCMGGNRTGKSEYSAKEGQHTASAAEKSLVLAAHMSGPTSIQQQHPLWWKYMPPEWQIDDKARDYYIAYKAKTGFSDMSFINPNGTWVIFLSYLQDAATALEGKEPLAAHPDELVPPDWVEALDARLAQRNGYGLFTFTPVHGYTPSVGIWLEGATTTRWYTSYVLPKDGGEVDVARALNLTDEQYHELLLSERKKRPAMAPQSVPEDVCAWLEEPGCQGDPDTDYGSGGLRPEGLSQRRRERGEQNNFEGRKDEERRVVRPFGFGQSQIMCPSNRSFELVPRVQRCVNPRYGVVYFKPCDNPHATPKNVIQSALPKGRAWVRMRIEGVADKVASNKIPNFDKRVHVLPNDKLPTEGRWFMFLDPASDRNFYMTWFVVPDVAVVWQEWPGDYAIPGIGNPGPWSVPSGRNSGVNDGARGEAQDSFGFGLLRYKAEIARIEGWEDYKRWFKDKGAKSEWPDQDEIYDWDEGNGADMVLDGRGIDLRAAGSPRVDRGQVVTLEDDLNDIGLFFDFGKAPKQGVEDGVQKIIDALDYNTEEPISFENRPRLYVAERCKNTIFSLEYWNGKDGQKGACKDPVDNVINFFNSGLHDDSERIQQGGFSRGTDYGSGAARKSVRKGRRPSVMDGGRSF